MFNALENVWRLLISLRCYSQTTLDCFAEVPSCFQDLTWHDLHKLLKPLLVVQGTTQEVAVAQAIVRDVFPKVRCQASAILLVSSVTLF